MSARATPRRARPSVVKRQQTIQANARRQFGGNYRRGRSIIALLIFLVVFGLLWLVNGEFTARFLVEQQRWSTTNGWTAHLIMSALEVAPVLLLPYIPNLPRGGLVVVFLLSLPFGIFDVLSSAVGVAPYLHFTGLRGLYEAIQNTGAGLIIAFLPERMIVWLGGALILVVNSD